MKRLTDTAGDELHSKVSRDVEHFSSDKELKRFGLARNVDFTSFSVNELLQSLEVLLRRVFLEGAIGFVSSLKWQTAYMLCFHLCTAEEEESIYKMVMIILEEEAARHVTLSLTTKSFAACFCPQLRKDLLFTIWMLNAAGGGTIPPELKLKIFFLSVDGHIDERRGCNAVLGVCSFMSRYWVPNQEAVGRICWGDDLIHQILPDSKASPLELISPCRTSVCLQDSDGSCVAVQGACFQSSYFALFAKCCGSNEPVILPHSLSDGTLVAKLASFFSFHFDEMEGFWNVEQPMLFNLLLLANYLGIKHMLDAGCKKVANMTEVSCRDELYRVE
jgi:hypothetical protein